ncbi:MAG: hypothetical protein J7604_00950 [Sporocytophaga sp.]|uniref:toxin-antitoxin system YwqK family antitoxin n=1 Tax=Sporocytophaga sp. TaxID=2231183 RepID=UPI001B29724A|nr:hypothetical protein [Sporocytophaga sp.]MBO9698739.1 hypothetical protein [Sporocytophaga sp.]
MKYTFALLFVLNCAVVKAQINNPKKFAQHVFNLMQECKYEELKNEVVSVNAVPQIKEFENKKEEEKNASLEREYSRGYSKVLSAHSEIYERGIDWKFVRFKKAYELPANKDNEQKFVLVTFNVNDTGNYLCVVRIVLTNKGYKLMGSSIKFDYFSDDVKNYLPQIGSPQVLPDVSKSQDFRDSKITDTVVVKSEKGVIKTYYSNKVKVYSTTETEQAGISTKTYFYRNGNIFDSTMGASNQVLFRLQYSPLGKLKNEYRREGNILIGREYYSNGNLKSEETKTDGKRNGPDKTFYYNGQERKILNYINDQPQGLVKEYDLFGKLIGEKNYSNESVAGKLEDLKYFISFEEVFKYLITNYETMGYLHRKPSGWFISSPEVSKDLIMLWSYKDQKFVTAPGLKYSTYGRGANEYYKKNAHLFKPKTLYSGYDGWSEDVIKVLHGKASVPDSLQRSLFEAYVDQIIQSLEKNDTTATQYYFESLKEFSKQPFVSKIGLNENSFAYNYLLIAMRAKHFNNIKEYNRFLSLVHFTPTLSAHGKRVLNECEQNALLFSQNWLLLYGIQLTENYRKDVIVIGVNDLLADWYRDFINGENDLKFSIADSVYNKMNSFQIASSNSIYKNISVKSFLELIQEKQVSSGKLELPYNLSNLDLHISKDKFYRFPQKTYSYIIKSEILQMDFLQAFTEKNPQYPLMFESNYIFGDVSSRKGFIVNLGLPFDSLTGDKEVFLNDPASIVFSIKSLQQIEPEYYNYYAYKIAGLVSLYSRAGKKENASQLIKTYMKLFTGVGSEISLHVRGSAITAAYQVGDRKEGDAYMNETMLLINSPKSNFTKDEIRYFKSDILSLYEMMSLNECIKKFYPEEYERKKEEEKKRKDEGAKGVDIGDSQMEDTIAK